MAIALRHELALLERARIDAEFQAMAGDGEYQRELRQILAEFAEQARFTATERLDSALRIALDL